MGARWDLLATTTTYGAVLFLQFRVAAVIHMYVDTQT